MIKVVFFDLYHTLATYAPSREVFASGVLKEFGIEKTAEDLGHPLAIADEFFNKENASKPMSKRSQEEKINAFAKYQAIFLKEAGVEPSMEIVKALMEKWQQAGFKLSLFEDVVPVLSSLKQKGLQTGLISNVEQEATPLLEELGLTQLLDFVTTSMDTGYTKPQPEIFLAALKQADVTSEEAVFIGDQYQVDILGAQQVGIKGILLDRGGYSKDGVNGPRIRNLHQLAEHLAD